MVKRKHEDADDLTPKIHYAVKILTRALKTARSFEQRKLARRGKQEDSLVLKQLDLHALAVHQVNKRLKIASQFATSNVSAQLLNTKPVKEVALRLDGLLGCGKSLKTNEKVKLISEDTQDLKVVSSPKQVNTDNDDDDSSTTSSTTSATVTSNPLGMAARQNKNSEDGARRNAETAVESKNATFIPSLLSGYWSGSESAEEIEPTQRKNRRGQRARRQIWERKYGKSANHLKKPKLATQKSDRKNEADPNMMPVKMRNTKLAAKIQNGGDGILHPSWEAAKSKREQVNAFKGKKITFD